MPEVPPEIVGKILRAAVDFPAAENVERIVVEDENAARAVAGNGADGVDINAVGAAVDGVNAGITRARSDFFRLNDFDDLRLARIGLDVEDVDTRRAKAGDDEIAALDVRMRRVRAERGTAGVPAEVVEFIADVRHGHATDDLGIRF